MDNGGESSPIEIDTLRNRYALTERDEATGLDDTWSHVGRHFEIRSGADPVNCDPSPYYRAGY